MEVSRWGRLQREMLRQSREGFDLRRPQIANHTEVIEFGEERKLSLHVIKVTNSVTGRASAREIRVVVGERSVTVALVGSVSEFAKTTLRKLLSLTGLAEEPEGVAKSSLSMVAIYGDKLKEDIRGEGFTMDRWQWAKEWKGDPADVIRVAAGELLERGDEETGTLVEVLRLCGEDV